MMKFVIAAIMAGAAAAAPAGDDAALREQARQALRKGAGYFRSQVAVQGTYLWKYSEDLSLREGEGVATATQGWIQPPGTPAVGLALLKAYDATGDSLHLDAAKETAAGLLRGQLKSGGWYYHVDFDPRRRDKLDYRTDGGGGKARRITTLDDNTTQCALLFLMRLDRALGFGDAQIHEAADYALTQLMRAQYPNGAWPQGFETAPDPAKFPVRRASLPDDWPRTWPGSNQYWFQYTLNDNVLADTIDVLFEAARIYGPAREDAVSRLGASCRSAALKAADFLLLAQLPEPQPAWAQQYDADMHPAWARKFEPPAITGGESQGILRTLLKVYRETGDRKYLDPIPRALAYLRRSRRADGSLARFYEMKSNEPLYFTKDYVLTKDDGDLPTHYAFTVADNTDSIARDYEKVRGLSGEALQAPPRRQPHGADPRLEEEVRAIVAAQDAQGRWVEGGGLRYHRPPDPSRRIVSSATFNRNVETLARYLEATGK